MPKPLSQKAMNARQINWLKLRVYGASTVFNGVNLEVLKSITPSPLHQDIDVIKFKLNNLKRYLKTKGVGITNAI